MKRTISALCLFLVFCVVLCAVCYAEGENSDTLANWNIRIVTPEGTTAVLQGSEYYIYAQEENSIPYVMLRSYRYHAGPFVHRHERVPSLSRKQPQKKP